MGVSLVLKNFRCFSRERPAVISLDGGVTAVVGPNDGGKSSLIRALVELRPLFECVASQDEAVEQAIRSGTPAPQLKPVGGPADSLICKQTPGPLELALEIAPVTHLPGRPPAAGRVTLSLDEGVQHLRVAVTPPPGTYFESTSDSKLKDDVLAGKNNSSIDLRPYREEFRSLARTRYFGPFRHLLPAGGEYHDMLVGSVLVSLWRSLLSGGRGRDRQRALEVRNDLRAMFGHDDLQITPAEAPDRLLVEVGGRSLYLDEVGAGLAHVFAVLANLVSSQDDPAYICIDEPELSLHPRLQVEFVRLLTRRVRKTVFAATHSFGLARAVADRVYTVSRDKRGIGTVSVYPAARNLAEILGELSFSAHRELGIAAVLLVEGPSEARFFRELLRRFQIEPKFLVLSLGGRSGITDRRPEELAEVKRIAEKVYAIVDSERGAAQEEVPQVRQKFREACAAQQIMCCVLERRATENYLPESIVKETWGIQARALQPFEAHTGAVGWLKTDIWRACERTNAETLKGTDLGAFVAEMVSEVRAAK